MELTPQMQKRRTAQFNNSYTLYSTDGSHRTSLDGETFCALYDMLANKIKEKRSIKEIVQAIHNIYAKKLGIAPVRVSKCNDLDCEGVFCNVEYLTSKNKTVIAYSPLMIEDGPFNIFTGIIHETKHAEQFYNVYRYVRHGDIPKDDKSKLILLYNFFNEYGYTKSFKLPYYFKFCEIDAFFFEFSEMQKLNKRYPEKFNGLGFYQEMWGTFSRFLHDFDYQKNGLNCKGLKKTYKALKSDIYFALRGDYGKEMQGLCKKVIQSGFNLDKAFLDIVKSLDNMYDQTVLLAHKVRELGLKAKFEKYGNLVYSKRVAEINPKYVSSNLEKTFFNLSNNIDDEFFCGK